MKQSINMRESDRVNRRNGSRGRLSCVVRTCGMAVAMAAGLLMSEARAETAWNLLPITGNAGSGWAAEPNWTWTDGNPMTDSGATWLLATQLDWNPSLTATYTNLVSSYIYNYYRIWRGPESTTSSHRYQDFTLNTGTIAGVGSGPATVVLFMPPEAGLYRFELAAGVYLQAPSAGYVSATVYTLSGDGTSATEQAVFRLNVAGGGTDLTHRVSPSTKSSTLPRTSVSPCACKL